MKMTFKNIALSLAIGLGLNLHSQSVDIERGDSHLEIFEFEKALREYKIAYDYDTTNVIATRKIAETYRRKGDLETSAMWYEKTLALDPSQKEDMLHYAEALKSQKKYEESLDWYRKYNSIEPEDERASKHIENEEIFTNLSTDTAQTILVKSLQINNRKPAFGVTTIEDKLIFSAANMGGSTTGNKTNPWNDLPYLDVYEGTIDDFNELVDVTAINAVNSKYNDGPAHFSEVLQTLFITRNNMKRGKPVKDKTGSVNLKIYAFDLQEDGTWGDVYELPFNSDSFSCGQPCVTPNGKFMYFSSNQTNGEGGADLYISENINGTWSNPVNLGNNINTKGEELFPYIDDNGILYFSSTGHAGFGGLDIFKVNLEDLSTKEPENIGYPMNSSKDDFSVVFDQTNVSGYFCSNRERGSSDNIYYFEINNLLQKILAGRIESSLPDKSLAGTELIIRNTTTGDEESIFLDDSEEFQFNAQAGDTYELAYQKEDSEEILTTITVEAVIADEFENLGVFTIYERMDVTVYDQTDSLLINDVMYKRFHEDGQFISENGDTLSSHMMMDMVSHNIDGNDIEINNELFTYNSETDTYTDQAGEEVLDEELEMLLTSQIFANPLNPFDGSFLAGIDLNNNIEDYIDLESETEASIPDTVYEEMDMSAMDWIDNQLATKDLSIQEMDELNILKANASLEDLTAQEYLQSISDNPNLIVGLSDVELIALGIDSNLSEEEKAVILEDLAAESAPSAELSAMDYINNQLADTTLGAADKNELTRLAESGELSNISSNDYLESIVMNPELASELTNLERTALGIGSNVEVNSDISALDFINETLSNSDLSELEIMELDALKSSNLSDLSATDWITVFELDPKKVDATMGVEKKALDLLDFGGELTAAQWLDLATRNEDLTSAEKHNLEAMKNSEEFKDLSATEYLSSIGNASIKDILSDNTIDYVAENTPNEDSRPSKPAKPANAVNMADVTPMDLPNPEAYALAADLPLEDAAAALNIEEIYFDYDQSYIRKDAQITLDKVTSVLMANKDVKMYVNAHTDARGSNVYNHYLSEKRAASVKSYLKARGINPSRLELNWHGEKDLANTCTDGVSCGENAHQLNRRAMFTLSKDLNRTNDHLNAPLAEESAAPEEIFSPFEADATAGLNVGLDDDELLGRAGLEMIYYDYNKSNIRRDAELILEVVAAAMKSNSKSLNINAHTDARGNNDYNAQLSQRRAKAAKNYLISQGVDSNRININWSGEVQLTNKCDDGVACTSNEHQMNRRATLAWK